MGPKGQRVGGEGVGVKRYVLRSSKEGGFSPHISPSEIAKSRERTEFIREES